MIGLLASVIAQDDPDCRPRAGKPATPQPGISQQLLTCAFLSKCEAKVRVFKQFSSGSFLLAKTTLCAARAEQPCMPEFPPHNGWFGSDGGYRSR